ncbi:regulatory protein RecX [Porphyromonas levii]|uniref:regulatory protein RecX n=1 Tax=Porphyromonas levii TaxID=28114 RepID=UPI001B8B4BA2|nr:regulatory protein RecX [Porphyromonas levii]MBR8770332.1 Regulatory protein RecX [Porphyromonas levii]
MEQEKLKRLLIKAGAYTAKYEKTAQEVREKLEQWTDEELTTAETDWIIEQLRKDKFVDEDRYAERYIRDKVYSLRKGPIAIRQELRNRGVPARLIEQGLQCIPYDDWYSSLRDYLAPRVERQRTKAKNEYDLRRRLSEAAYRRGYPSDIFNEVIDGLDLEWSDEDEDKFYY